MHFLNLLEIVVFLFLALHLEDRGQKVGLVDFVCNLSDLTP